MTLYLSRNSLKFIQLKLKPKEIYHLYNRGNNRQPIFLEKENYYYFLEKVKLFLRPNCEILAYTLMPNHFHFMICANNRSNQKYKRSKINLPHQREKKPKIKLSNFSWGLKHLLSSYARGINKRFNRTGSLFQQNTKYKMTSSESFLHDYSLWCFIYIHNNPKIAGLVSSPEEYEFTSYRDYLEDKKESLCNLDLGRKLLDLDLNELIEFKSIQIPSDVISRIINLH